MKPATRDYPLSRSKWITIAVLSIVAGIVGISTETLGESGRLKGDTYYVDPAQGDDASRGTSPSAAWKTLTKVTATIFTPGDRILFKSGGAWTGQLSPRGSGTEERPIYIGKYGGETKPVIDGAGTVEDVLLLKNQEYWEIQDLEITNTGKGAAARRGVHVVADNYGEMHHVYLRSLTIHDVNGIDSDKVNGGIHYSAIGDTKPSRFVDLRIEDNRISHVDRSGIFGWSTHWVRSKWYPSLRVIIRNNVLDDIGGDGIVVVATDGALLEHNVVSRANQRSEGYNVAIWAWSADNTVIQYNEAYRTHGFRDGEGFDSDWNSRNTLIQYNYSHDNDGGFLLVCNEGGHSPEESVGNIGTIVRYNVSQNDRSRGINIAGPVTHTQIYNNTLYTSKGRDVDVVLYSDWGGWASDTGFYNNLFYVSGTAKFSYGVSRDTDGSYVTKLGFGESTSNIFDYNTYFGSVQSPEDPHALTADPMLANPGTASEGRATLRGYEVRPSSPLINSGKTIPNNGGRDFWGVRVPSCGGTDRGAGEFHRCSELTKPKR
ncbi:MAG: right-handed parallel beta-helix repeat-containing protein [Acidobacteriia bacterium]|nr:right-handed parallel beta-helix repeat-containing protein [Terriglobia bacterium]